MSRETVTFQPAKNPRLVGKFKPVAAQKSGYGLVIHPTILAGPHCKFGFWDVSDPQTGCLVAYGEFPGREGAVTALVHAAMRYGKQPGGFRRALEIGRKKLQRQLAAERHPS